MGVKRGMKHHRKGAKITGENLDDVARFRVHGVLNGSDFKGDFDALDADSAWELAKKLNPGLIVKKVKLVAKADEL